MKKLISLLPILAIVLIAGCVSQATTTGPPPGPTEGPGITEPATEPLAPPSSRGVGFVLVSPQPGQHIFSNEINIVLAPVNFTVVPPGTTANEREGYFVLTFNGRPPVNLYAGGPGYQYTFTDVAEGSHTVRVEVVSANGAPLGPPLVRLITFTTGPQAPSGPTGCQYENPSCPADYACEDNVCVSRGTQIGQ